GDVRARFHDFLQRVALEVGRALHDLHQVWNKVSAALVLVLYFGPLRFHLLVAVDHVVVTAADQDGEQRGKREKPTCTRAKNSPERCHGSTMRLALGAARY